METKRARETERARLTLRDTSYPHTLTHTHTHTHTHQSLTGSESLINNETHVKASGAQFLGPCCAPCCAPCIGTERNTHHRAARPRPSLVLLAGVCVCVCVPSPTLSPTDPVSRGLLTLCTLWPVVSVYVCIIYIYTYIYITKVRAQVGAWVRVHTCVREVEGRQPSQSICSLTKQYVLLL